MPRVAVFRTDEASVELLRAVRRLLDRCFAGEFADDDWDHTVGGWHVVLADDTGPLAHAAVVSRTLEVGGRPFHSGYVEGVGTAPERQGEGLGSLAMVELDAVLRAHFELGALSTDRSTFYGRLGWERWAGPTFVRQEEALLRTADEDDGVMVLRFGASRHIDLGAPIVCEARSGDDW
jgi:aminoglycoside 2'-N-acetyltransferase I